MLILATTATAQFPQTITFTQHPLELSFQVVNQTQETQTLDIIIPTVGYELQNKPHELQPYESKLITATLYPNEKLVNQTYQSKIVIKIGNETKEYPITYHFKQLEKCPLTLNTELKEDNLITATFKNTSLTPIETQLNSIENLPLGNPYATNPQTIIIQPNNTRAMNIKIKFNETFNGTIKPIFDCKTSNQNYPIKQAVQINYVKPEPPKDAGPTGFVILSKIPEVKLPKMPDVIPNDTKEQELILDMTLAIVASLLLISFMSRLMKKMKHGKVR